MSEKEIIARVKEKYKTTALLLLNEAMVSAPGEGYDLKLLYQNKNFIWGTDDERFFLYEINFH